MDSRNPSSHDPAMVRFRPYSLVPTAAPEMAERAAAPEIMTGGGIRSGFQLG
jgi:hypothetical protein